MPTATMSMRSSSPPATAASPTPRRSRSRSATSTKAWPSPRGGAAVGRRENGLAVGTVTAVDADGGAVTYSIAGGADARLFAIDAATGALSFVAAPDFEAPGDADGDNVYDVVVSASDGSFTDTRPSRSP